MCGSEDSMFKHLRELFRSEKEDSEDEDSFFGLRYRRRCDILQLVEVCAGYVEESVKVEFVDGNPCFQVQPHVLLRKEELKPILTELDELADILMLNLDKIYICCRSRTY